MNTNQNKFLRIMVIIIITLLAIQYELGMAVNLGPSLPTLSPFGFSLSRISEALRQAGQTASVHAGLGSLLACLSIPALVWSLRSNIRSIQIFGSLGFVTVVVAMASGILFTLSGFQEDHYSLAMASNFILAFIAYFVELYFLKPDSRIRNDR